MKSKEEIDKVLEESIKELSFHSIWPRVRIEGCTLKSVIVYGNSEGQFYQIEIPAEQILDLLRFQIMGIHTPGYIEQIKKL